MIFKKCSIPFMWKTLIIYHEIFMLGKRGVTIGIRAGWSIRPNRWVLLCRVSVDVLLYVILNVVLCRELRWLEGSTLRLLLHWKLWLKLWGNNPMLMLVRMLKWGCWKPSWRIILLRSKGDMILMELRRGSKRLRECSELCSVQRCRRCVLVRTC